ncbi:NACHT domain-containing protein [Mycena sanguinolenta]|uniref:NACHT domain-containing protein n=1 Tax=Mycena sanguinolenta TaxID=230812 RepID=A0A8H6ZHG6_9AGAR|nr:NACHT domain-containing protein [Mycena sanguinolenta]
MPLITSSSGFQIHGGNFYDVAGDMNIHSTQSAIGLGSDPLTVLESGLAASTRWLVGPQRNGRQIEAARMMPYDHLFKTVLMDLVISYRPQRRYRRFQAHPESILSGGSSSIPQSTITTMEIPLPTVKTMVVRCKVLETRLALCQSIRSAERSNIPRFMIKTMVVRRKAIRIDRCLPQGNVSESSYPARDHRTHINIGGNVNQIQHHGEEGIRVLHNAVAADAFHDSAERFPQPRCHLETRTEMLEDLYKWSSDTDSDRTTFVGRVLVIVIDGLDECEGKEIQHEILRSIGTAVREGPLPLRFFVASRPEPHIREVFTGALQDVHFGINIEQSFIDVEKYLLDEFARIHREHHETMAAIPFPWPAPQVVDSLVQKSSGYFIYASTVIKFIDDEDFRPTERLKVIVGTKDTDDESPYAALDLLYTQILSRIPARQQLLRIMTVLTAKFNLSIGRIEQLLGLEPGDVRLTLRGMHSLVRAANPSFRKRGGICDDWSFKSESQIYAHHASFYDFLQDPRRAGGFLH